MKPVQAIISHYQIKMDKAHTQENTHHLKGTEVIFLLHNRCVPLFLLSPPDSILQASLTA